MPANRPSTPQYWLWSPWTRLRSWARGGATPVLMGALFLALLLSALLVYEAQVAIGSHRQAREDALRDYAAFANWQFEREFERQIASALTPALIAGRMSAHSASLGVNGGDARAAARPLLAGLAARARAQLAWCRCPSVPDDFFLFDYRTSQPHVLEPERADGVSRWLARALPEPGELPPAPDRARVVLDGRGGEVRVQLQEASSELVRTRAISGRPGHVLVYTVLTDPAGRPAHALGFTAEAAVLARGVAARIVREVPLLPPSLTARATTPDLLYVRVGQPDGRAIYESAPSGSTAVGPGVAGSVTTGYGSFSTRLHVRTAAAGSLVIGGLPRSRLPYLTGVFLLTVVLLSVALLQIRRHHELHQLRSAFISGVSHELRTPLAQIRLFSDLLDETALGAARRERGLLVIRREVQRLTFLVENILRFGRLDRRQGELRFQETDLTPVVDEVVEAFAPLALGRRAKVVVRQPSAPALAVVDRDAVKQVMLNLLDNAAKYGPPGQIITLAVHPEGPQVRLVVEDEGPGIPPRDRHRVWELYWRLPRDRASATGGSGIGLAIVKDIVQAHGGTIRIEDPPGGGARFVVSLPRVPSAPSSDAGDVRTQAPSVQAP